MDALSILHGYLYLYIEFFYILIQTVAGSSACPKTEIRASTSSNISCTIF